MSEDIPLHRPHGMLWQFSTSLPQAGIEWTEVWPGRWQFVGTKRQCLAKKKQVQKQREAIKQPVEPS